MINIQIIDNTDQILPALFAAEATVLFNDNEVQALNYVEINQPSVVLLNYCLRGADTPDYISLLQKASSESKIVVIAGELSDAEIVNCLLAGAKGYLEITQLEMYASKMVKVVDAGEAWITRRMVSVLIDSLR